MIRRTLLLFSALFCVRVFTAENGADVSAALDAAVEAKFNGAHAAEVCSESEFLRRVSLDLTGAVPSVDDAKAYLAAPDRKKLVEKLLESPEFDAWWGRFLLELTTGRRAVNFDDEYNGRLLYDWFKQQLKKRRGYDAIVSDLIAAKGNADEASPVHFILRYKVRPDDLAGAVSRSFLGTGLQCAQCHDHPFDKYTEDDFWGVAAFFARTRKFEVDGSDTVGVTDVKRAKKYGDDEDPDEAVTAAVKAATKAKPHWLDGKPQARRAGRKELAQCVVGDPLFAKNIANRVWAKLLGRGIVEPLESFGSRAKPTHPELLDALAKDFADAHYDLRALVKTIVLTKTYQRSSQGDGDTALFLRATLRPLSVDQLYQSILRATRYEYDEDGSGDDAEADKADKADDAPKMEKPAEGTMKKEPKPAAAPDEEETPEDKLNDADNKPVGVLSESSRSLRRALALLNQGDIHAAAESGARYCMKTLGKPVTSAHFDYVWLSLLSRPLNADEKKLFVNKHKRTDLEDAIWAVMNSAEFKFNH